MAFEGTIVNGQVVFDEPSDLADGTRVDVVEKPASTLLERMAWMVGIVDDMPADFAAEHDHYIHGTPRRNPVEPS